MSGVSDKIRKLLAMAAADSGASDQERETASRQAAALMAKHDIDEFDLMISEGRDWDLVEGYGVGTRPGKKNAKEVPGWIAFIAFGVKLFTGTRGALGRDRVIFRGARSDVELAQWMHDALVQGAWQASKGADDPVRFRNGYATAIQARLRAMAKDRADAVASGGDEAVGGQGTALAIIKDRLKAAMAERWGEEGSGRKARVASSMAGYNAGQAAHLPTNRPVANQGATPCLR